MKKFQKSRTDVIFTGVCGGLGDYFGVDSTWIRVGVVILSLCFWVPIVAYFVVAIVAD